jgi:hypothetical protein
LHAIEADQEQPIHKFSLSTPALVSGKHVVLASDDNGTIPSIASCAGQYLDGKMILQRAPARSQRRNRLEELSMIKPVHGIVRGKYIELTEDLGVAEAQHVKVQVTVIGAASTWGEGPQRCAGALADEWTEEDDRILAAIHQDRRDGDGVPVQMGE